MKTVLHSIIVVLVFLSFNCKNNILNLETHQQPTGTVALSFAQAPANITHVTATLSRNDYEPILLTLSISDTTNSASGRFSDISIGVWHLKVEALDGSNVVRYVGETNIEVLPGETTHAELTLLPATGNLDIHVTWGNATPSDTTSPPILYISFNGNTNDSSGFGNNGTSNNALYTADHHGNDQSAYLFNGTDNFITIPNSASLNPTNQLTIAFWLRVDSIVSNYMDVLVKGGPENGYFNNREYGLWVKQHFSPYYYLELKSSGDSSGQHELNSDAYVPGQWVFITAVVDRINHVMKIYGNGTLSFQVEDTYSSFNVNTYSLLIGSSEEVLYQHSPLKGAIDEVRIYRRALTPTQIQNLYLQH